MTPQEVLALARENRKDTENAVHKVKNIDEVDESKLKWPAFAQVKADGVYCAVIYSKGQAMAVSRTLRPLLNIGHLLENPHRKYTQDGVYIAELVLPGYSLEELSGMVNPNRVEPLDAGRQEALYWHAELVYHDFLTPTEFINGKSLAGYGLRWTRLDSRLTGGQRRVPSQPVASLGEFEAYAQEVIEGGSEGAVLKQVDALWLAGKKDHQYVKRVRELHLDLRCTGWEYGKGKRADVIAKLYFNYNGKSFAADLGKGWDDTARGNLTVAAERGGDAGPVGKVFHVKALQESSKGVLRLAKVMEMRIDKNVADQ